MTSTATPEWNKDAAGLLKQFLESGSGSVFLATLTERRPFLLSGADLNATALRAAEVAGYEKCLATILSLTEPPQEPRELGASENYPPLEDDSQWEEKKSD